MVIKLAHHAHTDNCNLSITGINCARQLGKKIGGPFISNALLYSSPEICSKQTLLELVGIDGADIKAHGKFNPYEPLFHEDVRLRNSDFEEPPFSVCDRVSAFIDGLLLKMERSNKIKALIVTNNAVIRCFIQQWFRLYDETTVINTLNYGETITITNKNTIRNPKWTCGKWGALVQPA